MPRPIAMVMAMTFPATLFGQPSDGGDWDCWESRLFTGSEPIIKIRGSVITLAPDTDFQAIFYFAGSDRRWQLLEFDNYQVIITPNGSGGYYDFTDLKQGERRSPQILLYCKEK